MPIASEIGRALTVETPELLAENVILIPVMPASVSDSSVSLAHAATSKYDKENGHRGVKIVDRTRVSGRAQCEELTHDDGRVRALLERQDRIANDEEAGLILGAKPVKRQENSSMDERRLIK